MTSHQIINAVQDDRVQDENLLQEVDFLLGTIGTEEVLTSVGNVRYVLLHPLVFLDGGYRYRLGRHHSNDESMGARFFIPNEGLVLRRRTARTW